MAVAREQRPSLQLLHHFRRQPLLAQTTMGPDTFDFCRMGIFRFVRAGGDNFPFALQHDKQPLRRQIPFSQLDFGIAGEIVAVARGVLAEQALNNRLQLRRFRRDIAE